MNIVKVKCLDGRDLLLDRDLIYCTYTLASHPFKLILLLRNGSCLPVDMDFEEYLDAMTFCSPYPLSSYIKNNKDYVRYVELSQKRADSGRP